MKPLTNEQIWGEPLDENNDDLIESILQETVEEIVIETDSSAGNCFDEAHYCPECQKPIHFCQCDLINQGEDYE